MKCQGQFVFKSIQHVDAGEFKTSTGDIIRYPSSYKLLVDENTPDGKINAVKFKIPENERTVNLVNELKMLKPYQHIDMLCNIVFYDNSVRVIPEKIQKLN